MAKITLYSKAEVEKIKTACQISVQILDSLHDFIKIGMSTEDINVFVDAETRRYGGIPAPLNYHGFPKSVCTSLNDVICHGIPSAKDILRDGDILNVDVTTIYDGYYGDTSRMYAIGKLSEQKKKLIRVTYESMLLGISVIKNGTPLLDISKAIQEHAEKNGFSVVRDFTGHGVGSEFHQFPNILHYVPKKIPPALNIKLQTGMVFTVEPMINTGSYHAYVDRHDGWTARTVDRGLSAQFEHTVTVTEFGYEILSGTKVDALKGIK